MIEGFDRQRCQRRNKIAAARGKVESIPIRFLKGLDQGSHQFVTREGILPASDDDALGLINGMLPAGADPLYGHQVYVHYVEAANGNFISDRHAFMGTSTLVNIAKGGVAGVAFMNSHRTGGLSSPAELPFGKTFTGQYEAFLGEDGEVVERAVLGFYMLRGINPNGANGPSTDDLDRMINGGQLADVSVGLAWGALGRVLCNVCGEDYSDCDHYAGTTYGMTDEDQQAAKDRGVPSGAASYTMEDLELGEVSGVYDGAVPGAGFAKGLRAFGRFSDEEKEQFRAAFHELMEGEPTVSGKPEKPAASNGPTGEKPMNEPNLLERFLAWCKGEGIDPNAAPTQAKPATPPAQPAQQPTPVEQSTFDLSAAIKAAAESHQTSAELLVDATCVHIEPAERAGLISLASAAFVLDGGKQGEACVAFKSLAKASVPKVDMHASQFVQIAGQPPRNAAASLKEEAEFVVAGAVKDVSGGNH